MQDIFNEVFKYKFLGYFDTKEGASEAYFKEKKKLHIIKERSL